MVEIGGEIRVRGLNHKGELWKIGIERPSIARLLENTDSSALLI